MEKQIVEPWHPDIINRKFVDDLFKSGDEARRFVGKNPADISGQKVALKKGDYVRVKYKTYPGVVVETYLVERWVRALSTLRPSAYEIQCLVQWAKDKDGKVAEPTVCMSNTLTPVGNEMEELRRKTEKFLKRLKEWDDSIASLKEFRGTDGAN